jgi:hypothetical protein
MEVFYDEQFITLFEFAKVLHARAQLRSMQSFPCSFQLQIDNAEGCGETLEEERDSMQRESGYL